MKKTWCLTLIFAIFLLIALQGAMAATHNLAFTNKRINWTSNNAAADEYTGCMFDGSTVTWTNGQKFVPFSTSGDGDYSGAQPPCAYVDLNASYLVDWFTARATSFGAGMNYIDKYNISTSLDNITWTFYVQGTGGGLPYANNHTDDVTARYIRYCGISQFIAAADNYAWASELEVWGDAAPPPSVNFYDKSQSPADINTINLFSLQNVTISAAINTTNGSAITSAQIYYKVNGSSDCWIYTNGTASVCGYQVKNYSANSARFYNFTLNSETDVYPATYMYNQSYMIQASKSEQTISGINQAIALTFKNLSATKQYTFFEAYFNATSIGAALTPAQIFYCNSSYDFSSSITTSSNCYQFDTINTSIQFNHTHGVNSKHILKSLPIVANKVGSVSVTPTSYIIIRDASALNTWSLRYIPNESIPGQIQTTTTNGIIFNPVVGTADAHIHQYNTNQFLLYTIEAQAAGFTTTNSSTYKDNIDLSLLGITTPTITRPLENYSTSGAVNITYTNSSSVNSGNFRFNITINNIDGTLNITVANITELSYTYYNNLSIGSYRVRIEAKDELNQTSSALSDIWYKKGLLNITAFDLTNNSFISSGFNIYKNGVLDGIGTRYYELMNLDVGTYNISIDAPGYALSSTLIDINASPYKNYTFNLYPSNSITIYIRDEATNLNISENVTIRFSNNATDFTNITDTGYLLISNLNATEYQIIFNSASYAYRTYTVTVGNRTNQILYAYLINSTSTTIFTIMDRDTGELLNNVLATMYRLINGTWTPVESKYTDVTGKVQYTYATSINYKFYLSRTGYQDYIFILNPVLFATYDIKMSKSSLINYSVDFDKLSIIYAPTSFKNDNTTVFNWIISTPYGILTNYGITLTFPGGSSSSTGNNAIGEQLSAIVNVSNANVFDTVKLDYFYTTTLSGRRNFTFYFPILQTNLSRPTFITNRDSTYGLGIFERALIVVLTTIFVVGIATLVGQPIAGLLLGLFMLGYMAYIGFIPLWLILPSMFSGILFLVWKGGNY